MEKKIFMWRDCEAKIEDRLRELIKKSSDVNIQNNGGKFLKINVEELDIAMSDIDIRLDDVKVLNTMEEEYFKEKGERSIKNEVNVFGLFIKSNENDIADMASVKLVGTTPQKFKDFIKPIYAKYTDKEIKIKDGILRFDLTPEIYEKLKDEQAQRDKASGAIFHSGYFLLKKDMDNAEYFKNFMVESVRIFLRERDKTQEL